MRTALGDRVYFASASGREHGRDRSAVGQKKLGTQTSRLRTPEQLWAASRWLYARGYSKLARVVKFLNYVLHKALLPVEAEVGAGLTLEHYALGMVIHPQVEIGSGCRVYHHVTLATTTWIGSPHKIVIGDGVTIGAHSILVARPNATLRIGDGAVIGAGSVVTKDVPAGKMGVGNPARKLRSMYADHGQ